MIGLTGITYFSDNNLNLNKLGEALSCTFKGKHIQSVNTSCEKCNIKYGKNGCAKCIIYCNKANFYHCAECGFCRNGKKRDYFHCRKCNVDLVLELRKKHRCVNLMEQECYICLDIIGNSFKSSIYLRCGHYVHKDCINKYILSTSNPKCGMCRTSIY